MPHTRTPSRPGMVAVGGPTAPKDVEAAFDGHMRDAGVSFDAAGLALNLTGEALRTMLDPGDRHVLAASRVVPLMRRLGTVEPYNAYLRLPECRVAGVMHQLLPVVARPSSGDVMKMRSATGCRLSRCPRGMMITGSGFLVTFAVSSCFMVQADGFFFGGNGRRLVVLQKCGRLLDDFDVHLDGRNESVGHPFLGVQFLEDGMVYKRGAFRELAVGAPEAIVFQFDDAAVAPLAQVR